MLIGFIGTMGAGKTLSMTAWAYALSRTSGMPVYANYHMTFPNSTFVDKWETVWDLRRGILCLDEAHIAFDSRAYADEWKRTHFILQTRKANLLVLYTTQHFSQVDKRIRNVTDLLVQCRMSGDKTLLRNQLIDMETGMFGKKITIIYPNRFYGLYDSYEMVANFAQKRKPGQWKR